MVPKVLSTCDLSLLHLRNYVLRKLKKLADGVISLLCAFFWVIPLHLNFIY